MIKINKNKIIGQVIFVVEGRVDEADIISNIFINLLGYEQVYYSNNETSIKKFIHHKLNSNRVLIVTHDYPQISNLNNKIEEVLKDLIENEIDYENMAMYFIYDRDRGSNTTTETEKAISNFKNSRSNDGFVTNGMLLLSYPSIESIFFNQKNINKGFESGISIKESLKASYKLDDLSMLTDNCLKIIKELTKHNVTLEDVDDFSNLNLLIYNKEEESYKFNKLYVTLSLLIMAFIDLGIIELDA